MLGIPTVTIVKESVETGSATVATDDDGLLNSATNSITMTVDTSMLDFTPKHLYVRLNIRHNSADDGYYMRFNGDTGSNYNNQNLSATGSSNSAAANTNNSSGVALWKGDDEAYEFSGGEFLIVDAFNTSTHKQVIGVGGVDHAHGSWLKYGRWANTAAITSIEIKTSAGNEMAVDSYFELNVVDEAYVFNDQTITSSDGNFASVGSITAQNGYLVAIGNLRTDRSSDADTLKLHYNGDTTSGNYHRQRAVGDSTTVLATQDNNDVFGYAAGDTATANSFGSFIHFIPNYSDGSNYRTSVSLSGVHADSGKSDVQMDARTWRDTSGITAIELEPGVGSNFKVNSRFTTYLIPDSDGQNTVIDRQELSGTQNPISFTSIPTTYQHFEVISYMRIDRSSTSHFCDIFLNGEVEANGYSAAQSMAAFNTSMYNVSNTSYTGLINVNANNAHANQYAAGAYTALNYLRTDRHKMIYGLAGYLDENGTDGGVIAVVKRGKITAAINRYDYDTNSASLDFMAGCVVVLRGISNEIPVGSDVDKVNGIALGSIEKFSGVTPANAEKLNTIKF